jgi:hypothetical protein
MERRDPKACVLENKLYPHGSDECIKGKCMICRDGDWLERIDVCPSLRT